MHEGDKDKDFHVKCTRKLGNTARSRALSEHVVTHTMCSAPPRCSPPYVSGPVVVWQCVWRVRVCVLVFRVKGSSVHTASVRVRARDAAALLSTTWIQVAPVLFQPHRVVTTSGSQTGLSPLGSSALWAGAQTKLVFPRGNMSIPVNSSDPMLLLGTLTCVLMPSIASGCVLPTLTCISKLAHVLHVIHPFGVGTYECQESRRIDTGDEHPPTTAWATP